MQKRLPHLIVFLFIAAAYLLGWLAPLDNALMDQRFSVLNRDAGGDVVVVEIDPRSLRELDVWPWPRGHHAALIDRLVAAGARDIALDIDFSSRSTAAADRALAQAIERADGKVILPIFRQATRGAGGSSEIMLTGPLAAFERHARTALVNVRAASDGLVRQYQTAEPWADTLTPSMATLMTGRGLWAYDNFILDFGIRP
jgi:CHASE2 domain-containing sensor protein